VDLALEDLGGMPWPCDSRYAGTRSVDVSPEHGRAGVGDGRFV